MQVHAVRTRILKEHDDLADFVLEYIPALPERSIVAVASKIVALAEGRTVAVWNEQVKRDLIRSESQLAIPTNYVWLTIKDGMVMASAGIDESNADGKLILLPRDSYRSAGELRKKLCVRYSIRELGILITDSALMPLRAGVVGAAVGYAGFRGIRDYRDNADLFGRPFKYSRTDVADSLASAATLVMGEGNESSPLAVITQAPVEFGDSTDRQELVISPEDDIFLPALKELPGTTLDSR